jgi:hypothetical protein
MDPCVDIQLLIDGNNVSKGDKVQVRWGTKGDIYDAVVKRFSTDSVFYRVRFPKMTADWDRWIPQQNVMKIINPNKTKRGRR